MSLPRLSSSKVSDKTLNFGSFEFLLRFLFRSLSFQISSASRSLRTWNDLLLESHWSVLNGRISLVGLNGSQFETLKCAQIPPNRQTAVDVATELRMVVELLWRQECDSDCDNDRAIAVEWKG